MRQFVDIFWAVVGGLFVLLLILEFVIGVDSIAWIVGDPIGDIEQWLGDLATSIQDAFRGKVERIKDSFHNR